MYQLTIPEHTDFIEQTMEFLTPFKGATIQIEHSLVSISKWERKWEKPFLSEEPRTIEETVDYIRCMTLTQNVDPQAYVYLTTRNFEEVNKYIDAKMTATSLPNSKDNGNNEAITAENIYYWIIANRIPIEFQKWHLNSLLALIRVCNEKNQEASGKADNKPKMSRSDIISRNREINELRKKQLNSKG